MTRRKRTQRVRPEPSLPLELISHILEEVAALPDPITSNSTLYHSALCCRSWATFAVSHLYAHLRLVSLSAEKLNRVGESEALMRHRTISLSCEGLEDWSRLNLVLDGCPGLQVLSLDSGRGPYVVPSDLLHHPNLAGIKSLVLCCSMEFPPEKGDHSVGFRLQQLTTDNRYSQDPYHRSIIKASLSKSGCSLRNLALTELGNASLFKPIAPYLKSLVLPSPPCQDLKYLGAHEIATLEELVRLCTSLSYLTFTSDLRSKESAIAPFIVLILERATAPLRSLTIDIAASHYSSELFISLEWALKRSEALVNLSQIEFLDVSFQELHALEGLSKFWRKVQGKGIKMVVS